MVRSISVKIKCDDIDGLALKLIQIHSNAKTEMCIVINGLG